MVKMYVLVLLVIGIVVYVWYSSSKQRKKKNEKKERQKVERRNKLYGIWQDKEAFYSRDGKIVDRNKDIIEDLHVYYGFGSPVDYLPVQINTVYTTADSEDVYIMISVSNELFEFKVVEVDECKTILQNEEMGTLYLLKEEYKNFEVGQILTIQFEEMEREKDKMDKRVKANII